MVLSLCMSSDVYFVISIVKISSMFLKLWGGPELHTKIAKEHHSVKIVGRVMFCILYLPSDVACYLYQVL